MRRLPLLLLLLTACAAARARKPEGAQGRALIRHAERLAAQSPEVSCARFAEQVYLEAGIPLPRGNSAAEIYASLRGRVRQRNPHPGDLAFVGPAQDRHVALVERVEAGGAVLVMHPTPRGIARYHLNPDHPGLERDPESGRIWNDSLRLGSQVRPAGMLFAGYVTLAQVD